MDRQTREGNSDALVAKSRVKGKKNPLKIKLEAITL